jgi:hypothetical protein
MKKLTEEFDLYTSSANHQYLKNNVLNKLLHSVNPALTGSSFIISSTIYIVRSQHIMSIYGFRWSNNRHNLTSLENNIFYLPL